MLKKTLALSLSVLMEAGLLAGCSGGSGASETKAAEMKAEEAKAEEGKAEEASKDTEASAEEKTLTVFH